MSSSADNGYLHVRIFKFWNPEESDDMGANKPYDLDPFVGAGCLGQWVLRQGSCCDGLR